MDDLTKDERAENEHALDPRETWGQGTDASHPVSAIDAVDAATPTAGTSAAALDGGEMIETANRLRRASDSDVDAPRSGRDDLLPGDDESDTIPDDMPLT